jgi:hypothetical protein
LKVTVCCSFLHKIEEYQEHDEVEEEADGVA